MTKQTADMAEQTTSHPEDVEDAEEEAPSVSLNQPMDVMTRQFEGLLAEQDELRTILFPELLFKF